jgi:hypothetical protein
LGRASRTRLTPETPLPREAKRSYKALIGGIVRLPETADDEDLKLNVAEIAWRDAYSRYVEPALRAERIPGQAESPEVMGLRSCLDLAEQVLPATPADLMTAVFRLGDLARRAWINLSDIPATLLLYLAAEPRFRRPLEPVSGFGVSPFGPWESEPGKSAVTSALRSGQDAESASKLFDTLGASGIPGFALRDPAREAEASELAQRLSSATGAGELRMASWPSPSPVPRMKLTGSVTMPDPRASLLPVFSAFGVSQVNRPVSPRLTTTKAASVHTVARTDRIFVHSASIRSAKRARWAAGAGGGAAAEDAERALCGRPAPAAGVAYAAADHVCADPPARPRSQ